jgi:DNA-binding LytR/AlgR family response regulator
VALIFITNLRQYAIKGYEVNALDYIVKPLGYYDFEMKFIKAIEFAKMYQNATIAVKIEDKTKIIILKELYFIEIYNHKLVYHTEKGRYETNGQLSKAEESLRGSNFTRCSNSYLVNLQHVMEIHNEHIVVGQTKVPVSRRRKKEFMKEFTNYIGRGVL